MLVARLGDLAGDRVAVLGGRPNAMELKWTLSRLDWFAGARMHATIGAFSSGVPTLGLGYSDKAQGVFAECGIGDEVADLRRLDAPRSPTGRSSPSGTADGSAPTSRARRRAQGARRTRDGRDRPPDRGLIHDRSPPLRPGACLGSADPGRRPPRSAGPSPSPGRSGPRNSAARCSSRWPSDSSRWRATSGSSGSIVQAPDGATARLQAELHGAAILRGVALALVLLATAPSSRRCSRMDPRPPPTPRSPSCRSSAAPSTSTRAGTTRVPLRPDRHRRDRRHPRHAGRHRPALALLGDHRAMAAVLVAAALAQTILSHVVATRRYRVTLSFSALTRIRRFGRRSWRTRSSCSSPSTPTA
jgi:hypothetical protein